MKKTTLLLLLVILFTKVTNGQTETINGDKLFTGEVRFNKGLYYGVNSTNLPSALPPAAYVRLAVINDPLSNPNLPQDGTCGSTAFGATDQSVTMATASNGASSEPRFQLFKSRGSSIYTPTNVLGGDVSGNIQFNNYFNGAYRKGVSIFSQTVDPGGSIYFPASTLTFSIRKKYNITSEIDPILKINEFGQIMLLQTPSTASLVSNPLLTRNPTTGAIELQSQNALYFASNGFVGINTATPREHLSVNGKIRAKEIKLELINWPDYVFDENYHSLSLHELEQFIKLNKHLPGIPSAKEVALDGVDMGVLNKNLLQKIEELTLHLIEQHKKIEAQSVIINKILSK